MQRLHTFQLWEGPQAGMYREMLAQQGVECLVKNDQLFSAVGEIPFIECFPELWVIDDEILPRARLLLDGWLRQDLVVDDKFWVCSACGERCGMQFELCWNCMTERE